MLTVSGDASDAERELGDFQGQLAAFARETAEADVELSTEGANATLDELKAKLSDFSAQQYSADVNLEIAKAQADLAVLQAELSKIDGEDVTVDVDVRRGIVEKLASLSGEIDRIGQSTEVVSQTGFSSFISKIGEAANGTEIFGASLTEIGAIGPFVIAAVVSIVGQLVAIVATAASAAGGIGALAIAFGATLLPAIALGVGAIANFKAESETAGTAAHALKETFGDVAESFKSATKGGSAHLFQGISEGLREISPLLDHLRPAFTRLGEAGGDAIKSLAEQFSSPAWQKFFTFAIDSLAEITPLIARSFGAFSTILAHIAQASMPFLIGALRDVAQGLEGISDKTSDIGGLRDVIGGMVHSLQAVGQLLGGLADLTAAFVEAFAPFGDGIVESLAEGAHALADWLRSSEGTDKLKEFFEDTGPLASELAKLFLNVALALIQIGQFVAPAFTPLVEALNDVVGAANAVLSFLNDHIPAGLRKLAGELATLSFAKIFEEHFGAIVDVAKDVLGKVGDAASAAWSGIVSGIQAAGGAISAAAGAMIKGALDQIRGRVEAARDVGAALVNGIKAGFNAVKGPVIAVGRAIVTSVINSIRSQVNRATAVGRAIINAVRGGFNDARGAVISGARAIITAALNVLRGAIDTARNIGTSIINAVKGGFNAARSAVTGAINDLRSAALNLLRGMVDAARAAGESIINGLAGGIKAGADAVISTVQSIYDHIKSIIEAPLHVHIDVPSVNIPGIPGIATGARDIVKGGLARVGEKGEELVFMPQGADVYTANETRRILRALAGGVAAPSAGAVSAPATAMGGGGGTTIINQITPIAGGGSPDPEVLVAQLNAKLRARRGT